MGSHIMLLADATHILSALRCICLLILHTSTLFARELSLISAVSVASQKHAAMKLNIANPSTGQMKVKPHTLIPSPKQLVRPRPPARLFFNPFRQVIECEDDRKLRNFYDKRINQVIGRLLSTFADIILRPLLCILIPASDR